MATGQRRGMDWPTAWRAMLPVYGGTVILHAFFPLFAVPFWIILLFYGYKVLDAARVAESPWIGRGSPRPYFYTVPVVLLANLAAFALIPSDPSGQMALAASVSGIATLVLLAMFVGWSAPPGVRDRKSWVRSGVLLEIGSALLGPAIVFGVIALTDDQRNLVFLFGPTGLAAASAVAFLAAGRREPLPPTEPARRQRRS